MKLSKHAKIRSQQRGFSQEDVRLLILIGEATEKPGNVTEYKIGKQFIQRLDKLSKKAALVAGNNVITVYNLR
jgi:hypothetical protein